MASPVQVTIDPSQFPDPIRHELRESFRRREVNHKFLYDGVKQTQRWLELHQACSPSRTDPDCTAAYDAAFQKAASRLPRPPVHLIGLGCGGGQKDTRCLHALKHSGKQATYTPADVSLAMVLTAREQATAAFPNLACTPLVLDLGTAAPVLSALLQSLAPETSLRLLTCFGLMPNFEPDVLVPALAKVIRGDDHLLLSANLAPGDDYDAGMRQILPLYDNAPTGAWLFAFLQDAGINPTDGRLEFTVEPGQGNLKRIVARFRFQRQSEIRVEGEHFVFRSGDSIRVFFSYRHTPAFVHELLEHSGLIVTDQWITSEGGEGIFLVRRKN